MFTFDNLEVGKEIGRRELTLDKNLVSQWQKLFPDDLAGDLMPAGMTAIVLSRAYSNIVAPRPPGNIHGGQRFEVMSLPRVGEKLLTTVTCAAKELKKERHWVDFAIVTTGEDGRICFQSQMKVLWAT